LGVEVYLHALLTLALDGGVVSFTPRPLYLPGKNPRDPWTRRLSGPHSQSGRDGEENKSHY